MLSLRENAKVLRQNGRKGVSLVIAMCASFLIFSFAFSMLLSASALLSARRERLTRERCRQMALSFAQVLQQELSREEGSFLRYVETALDGESGISRAMAEEGEATLIVSVLRGRKMDPELPEGSFHSGDTEAALERIRAENSFSRLTFTLETRAELGQESYTCKDPYVQTVSYQPLFFLEDAPLYWAEGWYLDRERTLPLTEEALIRYRYDPDRPIRTAAQPAWEEGGAL